MTIRETARLAVLLEGVAYLNLVAAEGTATPEERRRLDAIELALLQPFQCKIYGAAAEKGIAA